MAKKVLIVDDDTSILDALSIILEDEGYDVETAGKDDETYRKVKSFAPDIILLDVLLSGKDGREICKQLKSSSGTKQIPVIMISAHPSAGLSYMQFGAEAFLAKPFETEELLHAIEIYL